jgi:hypothetical protein
MSMPRTGVVPPVIVHGPLGAAQPLLFDSPHSGYLVPPHMTPAAPPEALRELFDERGRVREVPAERLAALAAINRAMSAKLRERKEAAAKGLEELP